MEKALQKLPLSRRWPVAFWAGAFLCFVALPLFLLDIGLENILSTRRNIQKQECYRQLRNNLEQLLQYRNSRHYYHALLKRIFDLAESSADPMAYLKRAIPHLKERNPGIFRFIVWRPDGTTEESLTDEKGYRYIVKTLFETFRDITNDSASSYPGAPEALPAVDKKINLLRSYLGAFLIGEKMNLPLLRGSLGEIVMASSELDRSHFWFRHGNRFSIMANVHLSATESSDYLKKLVSGMNRNPEGLIRCGISELVNEQSLFTGFSHEHGEELLMEVNKFQNFSEPNLETENYLITVSMLNPLVTAFSFMPKSGVLIDAQKTRKTIMTALAALILAFTVFLAHIIFVKNHIISIRWKLAILFIYANGLPLMILGFIGYEYLQQTRRLLLDQAREHISNMTEDFDARFENIKQDYASVLNKEIEPLNAITAARPLTSEDPKSLYAKVSETRPYDFILSDKDGKFLMMRQHGQRSSTFFSSMSKNLINYINFTDFTPQELFKEDRETSGGKGKIKAESFLSGKTIVFHQFLRKTRKVSPEQMGAEGRQYYWNMIGDAQNRRFHNLMVVSWRHDVIQENYIRQSLERLNQNSSNYRFYAIVESNGMTYPVNEKIDTGIFNLFRQTFSLKTTFTDEISIDGQNFAAFGTIGRELNRIAIVGLIPLNVINDRINDIQTRLILFAILSLGLTIGIGRILSLQIMKPVRELENGVQAIGRQDFRYRLPITSADEFGHLSSIFNGAIESLEDLEIARIVQENLFPQENLLSNNLVVTGKSVAMTRLGGDYYDFFNIDERRAGILMGDVAGHGIPAAILMAMAKASVLMTDKEKTDPALMLAALHKVIHRVKSSKIKRMMTCQYFCIDTVTGEYLVSNAGHCFPAVIRNGGHDIELIKLIGTPLGITKKPKYDNTSLKLEDGDIVLLYTDGIIESQNAEGKEMGFDNFADLLKASFSNNLEEFYQNIFASYKEWSPKADDDITMVLMRFSIEGAKA